MRKINKYVFLFIIGIWGLGLGLDMKRFELEPISVMITIR
jgi:hypothetical protein